VREIRLKISELFEIDAQSGDDVKDLGAITMYVLKHYAFLSKPILVRTEGDEVVISFPEEADARKDEARRLVDSAVKRASEGSYEKAIGIYKYQLLNRRRNIPRRKFPERLFFCRGSGSLPCRVLPWLPTMNHFSVISRIVLVPRISRISSRLTAVARR
jgi:hypothetical protein